MNIFVVLQSQTEFFVSAFTSAFFMSNLQFFCAKTYVQLHDYILKALILLNCGIKNSCLFTQLSLV